MLYLRWGYRRNLKLITLVTDLICPSDYQMELNVTDSVRSQTIQATLESVQNFSGLPGFAEVVQITSRPDHRVSVVFLGLLCRLCEGYRLKNNKNNKNKNNNNKPIQRVINYTRSDSCTQPSTLRITYQSEYNVFKKIASYKSINFYTSGYFWYGSDKYGACTKRS